MGKTVEYEELVADQREGVALMECDIVEVARWVGFAQKQWGLDGFSVEVDGIEYRVARVEK